MKKKNSPNCDVCGVVEDAYLSLAIEMCPVRAIEGDVDARPAVLLVP